jgi:hypothetical protein
LKAHHTAVTFVTVEKIVLVCPLRPPSLPIQQKVPIWVLSGSLDYGDK